MAAGAFGLETVRRSCMARVMAGDSGEEREREIMGSLRSSAKPGSARGALALGLALIALLSACSNLGVRAAPSLGAEIRALNHHLEEQFRTGNLLGVADLYADDAVLIDERGQRTTGREEIDAYWSAIESPVEWQLEIRSIHGSDEVAYELGTSTLRT